MRRVGWEVDEKGGVGKKKMTKVVEKKRKMEKDESPKE